MKFSGGKLKKLRKASGLKWKAWSDLLDTPIDTIYGYESGRRTPTSDNLMKISEKLKVKPDFFYEQ